MKRKRKRKFKIAFILLILSSFSTLFVTETSKALEETYFSRFKEGYKEGFLAGNTTGFIDGYEARKVSKK